MKNRYVAKILCITLISAMVLGSSVGVMAGAEETPLPTAEATVSGEDFSDPEETLPPADDPTDIPTEDPTEPPVTGDPTEPPVTDEPTETPGTEDPTETPGAEDPTEDPTETPEETEPPVTEDPGYEDEETDIPVITETPTTVNQKRVDKVNNQLKRLKKLIRYDKVTKKEITKVKKAYDALTPEEQALVKGYKLIDKAEKHLEEMLEREKDDESSIPVVIEPEDDGSVSGYTAVQGEPVTYVGGTIVSNLHAGRSFYLDQLKETYALTFKDDFEKVMDSIEKEYRKKNKISKDMAPLVRNWQDVLAIYVLRQKQAGKKEFKLDKSAKEELAAIFEELNPVIRDKKNILLVSYGNIRVADYIKEHKQELNKKEKALLNKYTGKDCALLCSTVTAAKGFIRESAGDEIAEERVNIMAAAYSLVGKVGYFWGGKSRVIGWDSSWGTAATVDAAGSRTSGTTRAYGLDCSGFVTWAFVNGYKDAKMGDAIGEGTSDQWVHCKTIKAEDAQPGDLVFQRGPEAGSNNHVGILVGQTDAGDWIAVHCSSGQNGVTVGEAYSASFRYIRCPSIYPTKEELIARQKKKEEELLKKYMAQTADSEEKESLVEKVQEEIPQESAAIEIPESEASEDIVVEAAAD